mmetsp:Transcript_15591/g.25521  ORF Transcript_15591/g.25521 Transcript_15591/m.25521 type:complete len:306 (-) Transcript_15591:700-1617(-)|eukprot:CAMPEP_0203766584 /NCGR_PEP_ID=MMETSP0099_2-20121227/503_1 /ASSEMBLY_ACC=CAM_ASM_000209 /TAXON_ID=96639 /ORGANISM=" , Strain NY0313808BC1" /LENGTH=305 /DNA_ID=CAMNT_0050662959 /DNA_START=200 /DNA_END=1117 /DNA_ORIENTATION=+
MAAKAIILTGGTRGIGYALLELLASGPDRWTVFVGGRSADSCSRAIEKLGKKGNVEAIALPCDMSDTSDIHKAVGVVAEWVESNDQVDALVNNAGVLLDARWKGDSSDEEFARQIELTIDINFKAVSHFTQGLIDRNVFKQTARVISVSSGSGYMAYYALRDPLKKMFMNEDLTLDELFSVGERFKVVAKQDGKCGLTDAFGYDQGYGFSKLLLSHWTRVMSRQHVGRLSFMACSPGFVKTDMTANAPSGMVLLEPAEGAGVLLYLLTSNDDQVTGCSRFWRKFKGDSFDKAPQCISWDSNSYKQ